jgi:hypothetical protein
MALALASSAQGITRVGKRVSFMELYAGGGSAHGEYDGVIPDIDFIINNNLTDVKAEDVYNPSWHIGVGYGRVHGGMFFYSVGFRFTHHSLSDTIPLQFDTILVINPDYTLNQYDIDINVNHYLLNANDALFAPFIGLGWYGGITSAKIEGFETDNKASLGLGFNFGFDVKLWNAGKGGPYVTLSSINSLDFVATDDRPRYLKLGGGIKYFFQD